MSEVTLLLVSTELGQISGDGPTPTAPAGNTGYPGAGYDGPSHAPPGHRESGSDRFGRPG